MLGLVRLVGIWVLLCLAFVGRKARREGARIRIMRVGGAVGRFVMMFFLVGNIIVSGDVMRGFVGAARC
jgi:hypothetical protein